MYLSLHLNATVVLSKITRIHLNLMNLQVNVVKEMMRIGQAKSKKGYRYSHGWLLTCLLLYIRGPKTYRVLSNLKILPLPSKSTIARYLKSTKSEAGFSEEFFQNFQHKLEKIEKVVPGSSNGILSFDEMSVKSVVGIDVKTMKFNGLINYGKTVEVKKDPKETLQDRAADHALVFMFSSLKAAFHQPIAVFASKGTTKSKILAKLLLTAIVELENHGAKVLALVCDGAQTNRGVWTQLGMRAEPKRPTQNLPQTPDSPLQEPYEPIICSFANPAIETDDDDGKCRRVFIFSDAPHLFKCIRNRLWGSGRLEVLSNKFFSL